MRWAVLVAALTLGALSPLSPPSPALAQTMPQESRTQLVLRLTSDRPDASSGLQLEVAIRDPDQPEGKAPQLVAALFALPDGTVIDTSALPQCNASNEEIAVLGTAACPEAARVGAGDFQADTGLGAPVDPIAGANNVFNGPDELIEIVTLPGTTVAGGIDRLQIRGSTLTANPPFTPGGPPDGRTAPRRISFTIAPRSSDAGLPYITTPATCPPDGAWQTSGTFTYDDGVTETLTDTTACTAATGPSPDPPPPSPVQGAADAEADQTARPATASQTVRSLPTTGAPSALTWTAIALLLLAGTVRRLPG